MITRILPPEAVHQGDLILVNAHHPCHPLPQPDLVTVAGKGSFVAQQNLELVREAHLAEIEGHLRTAAELARRCQISQAELEEML